MDTKTQPTIRGQVPKQTQCIESTHHRQMQKPGILASGLI